LWMWTGSIINYKAKFNHYEIEFQKNNICICVNSR
jgi:hypothetical protein